VLVTEIQAQTKSLGCKDSSRRADARRLDACDIPRVKPEDEAWGPDGVALGVKLCANRFLQRHPRRGSEYL